MADRTLPTPRPGDATDWVAQHLAHLADGVRAAPSFRGGRSAAVAALERFDVTGYAARRNEVWPTGRRGASRLGPWIRHGLLTLQEVWDHVGDGPGRDMAKFRDELLWQEYARHLTARLGHRTSRPLRAAPAVDDTAPDPWEEARPEGGTVPCLAGALRELREDGWVVNQARMWLASQWTVRGHRRWTEGEDEMFRHLLDGSRAANRLGWQWTTGAGNGRPYGFSRRQVERRAPGLCRACELRDRCPVEAWPEVDLVPVEPPALLRRDPDPDRTAGPAEAARTGDAPSRVWITAESLGDVDPALAAHLDLPAVFVFDEPLLARLHLAGHRLVFLAECLADLAQRREVEVLLGDPVTALRDGGPLATTFTPVPGGRARRGALGATVAVVHPWPWLVAPHDGPIGSFSAWRKGG
ncbi:MAG: FAD-binding domain-containing protein [Microthrixaceae bacterium]